MLFKTHLEVKLSTIPGGGNGVFTLRDIKQGEPVCYYAGHDEPMGENNMDPYAIQRCQFNMNRIGLRVPEGTHGVGQLINDASSIDFANLPLNEHGFFSLQSIKKLENDYHRCSFEKLNVRTIEDGEQIIFYALKDIKAGEELFFGYGPDYWVTHFCATSEYPLHKLLVSIKIVKEILDEKNNESAGNFMNFIGIEDGGIIHQVLGVNPDADKLTKLRYILEQIIRLSS
jgi:hypothetical protein